MSKKLAALLLLCALCAALLCGCTVKTENFVFGTNYSLELKGSGSNEKAETAEAIFSRLDSALSTSIASSDVARINAAAKGEAVKVGEDFAYLFGKCLELYIADNAFNITVFPLVELWGFSPDTFTGNAPAIPTDAEVAETFRRCCFNSFIFDVSNVTITKLTDGAKLDFGAIAKGYAVDLAYNVAKDTECVINVGGTIKTSKAITVGIDSPRGNGYAAKMELNSGEAVATSGDYERYYTYNGKRYCHIIDESGYPSGIFDDDPIISVTVVGAEAMMCDVLSTLAFVKGTEAADLITSLNYSALILTENTYHVIGDKTFEIVEDRQEA